MTRDEFQKKLHEITEGTYLRVQQILAEVEVAPRTADELQIRDRPQGVRRPRADRALGAEPVHRIDHPGLISAAIDSHSLKGEGHNMHNTERLMINEQLSQLFDLADELRRRIDELAEMVANPPQAPAQVLHLKRKDDYEQVVKELQNLGHLLPSIRDSQATSS